MNTTFRNEALGTLLLALVATVASGRIEANVGEQRKELTVEMEVKLHGTTPTMAWSPDSSGLVVNAAFEYFIAMETMERYESSLGIHVLDLKTKETRRLHREAGFHPLWVDHDTVAWGNSIWNEGPSGVYIGDLSGKVSRLVEDEWVFFTLPSINPGKILYVQEGAWIEVDTKNGATTLVGPAEGDRWDLVWRGPENMVAEQCHQTVGNTSIAIEDDRYLVRVGRRSYPTAHTAFVFKHDWSCEEDGACGPVRACLSPDGKHLAYFTPAYNGYDLYVVKVPRL